MYVPEYVCVLKIVFECIITYIKDRERQRETERETERDRERQRETERDRERQRLTERDR